MARRISEQLLVTSMMTFSECTEVNCGPILLYLLFLTLKNAKILMQSLFSTFSKYTEVCGPILTL